MLGQMGLVSAMTMLSRVFGLFRDVMITAIFGTSLLNSAFTAAFAPQPVPSIAWGRSAGSCLMPNLSEEMESNGKEAVFRLVNKTLSWLCDLRGFGSYRLRHFRLAGVCFDGG